MPRTAVAARRVPLRGYAARVLVLLGVMVAGVLGAGAPAFAHTALRSSAPADGAALAAPPTEVRLDFTEAPAATAHDVAVTRAGQAVRSGPVRVAGSSVVAPVTLPGPGEYTVAYRVVAGDGHPVQGIVRFTVAGDAGASAAASLGVARAASKAPVPPPVDNSRWPHVVIAVVVLLLVGIAVVLATGQRPPKRKRF